MKKTRKHILLAALVLLCLAVFAVAAAGRNQTDQPKEVLLQAMEAYDQRDPLTYPGEELRTNAYQFLSARESEAGYEVYAVSSSAVYGFSNGSFMAVGGTGAIPCKYTLTKGEDGALTCTDLWLPPDGGDYASSIRETFPLSLRWQARHADVYQAGLRKEQTAQAQAYLDKLGRQAEILSDTSSLYPTFPGMSQTAFYALMDQNDDDPDASPYPNFVGTQEALEHGTRWVYETAWDHDGSGNGTVTYTKYPYDAPTDVAQKIICQVQGDTVQKLSP